jgi:hypothetical protein
VQCILLGIGITVECPISCIFVALFYLLLYISPTVTLLPPFKQELTDRILASLFQEQEIGLLGFLFFLKENIRVAI